MLYTGLVNFESAFLDRLSEGVIVFDGATGTQIQAANVPQNDFILRPDAQYSTATNAAAERLG
ncbi:MAG: hypothetical protein JNM04_05995, partial [Chthonomonas sp.]|nr:hypothetical protein [Chthonomonas sp.]